MHSYVQNRALTVHGFLLRLKPSGRSGSLRCALTSA